MADTNLKTKEVQKKKKCLEEQCEIKEELIHEQEKQLKLWNGPFSDMKQGPIEGLARQEILESENKVLKEQEGENEEFLMLPPNAKALLLQTLVQRLGETWDKASGGAP